MDERTTGLFRLAALAGLGYAVLTVAGDLTIGKFPDSGTSIPELEAFYARHHAHVAAGGMLYAWATVLLVVFGVALCVRLRRGNAAPGIAAALLVGTAVAAVGGLDGATDYWNLGHIGHEAAIAPAALQAWHVAGSEGGLASGGGLAIFLFAAAAAGIAGRALPRWLALPALVLAPLQLTPVGFVASLVFLLWAAVAGVAIALRPAGGPVRRRQAAAAQPA